MRRHRAVLTAAVLVAISLVAGTTVSVWQAARAAQAASEARRLYLDVIDRSRQVYGLSHIACSNPIGGLFDTLRLQGDVAAIRELCEGWIRELLARPPESDKYERYRRSVRLSSLVVALIKLHRPIPFDGELAVRAAEQAAALGDDAHDNNWTRLSLVHLRLGHAERAQWALRESINRHNGDNYFDSVTQALIHARRGELAEAQIRFNRAAREHGRHKHPPGYGGYEAARDEIAALLGLADLPDEVFARP
jgi:hypothetical protein